MAAPFDIYFNKVPGCVQKDMEIDFKDLLQPGLKESLHFTYKVSQSWLEKQYKEKNMEDSPQTIFCGDSYDNDPNHNFIKCKIIQTESKLGSGGIEYEIKHHTKMSIFDYETHMRIAILSANLSDAEWTQSNQAIWWSPPIKYEYKHKLGDRIKGESKTYFKKDLLNYLARYSSLPLKNETGTCNDFLKTWIARIEKGNFADIKVVLIASPSDELEVKLRKNLCYNGEGSEWRIIAQAPGVNTNYLDGLGRILQNSGTLQVIYPSEKMNGDLSESPALFWNSAGIQPDYTNFNIWKANDLRRSSYVPHLKTYCKISKDYKKIKWFLMTSANISNWAWGTQYELGVSFLPKFFDKDYFVIDEDDFPIMYDLPLTRYEENDRPCKSS